MKVINIGYNDIISQMVNLKTTFRKIHGPQFIEILVYRQAFALASYRTILMLNSCTSIYGIRLRCFRYRLFLCFVGFIAMILFHLFHAAKIHIII